MPRPFPFLVYGAALAATSDASHAALAAGLAAPGGDMASAVAAAPTTLAGAGTDTAPDTGLGTDLGALIDIGSAVKALGITQGGVAMVGVELNGRDLQDMTELGVRHDVLMIKLSDLQRFRLRAATDKAELIDSEPFVPLTAVPGLRFGIDAARQLLRLSVPAEAFEGTVLNATHQLRRKPDPVMATAFLNYDLSIQQGSSRDASRALFLDAGYSNHWGYVENTMTVTHVPGTLTVTRLDTSFVHDDPVRMRRLSIGDSLTRGTSWSPQIRFGGVRYATQFSLQPRYLSFPTPDFAGKATLPSNVELYINDVLGYQAPVDEGPFTLNSVPIIAGAGNVALVVKDALGVERRIVSNFYVSTQLLRPGLSDFSFEAGAQRDQYGSASFDYRRPFGAATWRYGLNRRLTVEGHAEGSRNIQTIGGGLTTVFESFGEVGGSLVASNAAGEGQGIRYRAYAMRSGRVWSLSAVYQGSTANYRQIGYRVDSDRLKTVIQANLGFSFGHIGSINAALAKITRGDGSDSRVISANYGRDIRRLGFLSAYVIHSRSSGRNRMSAGLTFTAALGRRTSATLSATQNDQRFDIQKTVPDESGFGYHVSAGRGSVEQQQGDVSYRGRIFDSTLQVSRFNGQTAGRLTASGSLVFANGELLGARRLAGSYAVVDVDGQPGVRVYQDNRFVAETNRHGHAIVTQMRPYEENRISIEPKDLELDATLGAEAQLIVPPSNAAVRAHFQVRNGRAGSLIVSHADGTPVAAGSSVTVGDKGETGIAGFGGDIFIHALSAGLKVVVHERAGDCAVTVPDLPKGELMPVIGPLVCKPEARP